MLSLAKGLVAVATQVGGEEGLELVVGGRGKRKIVSLVMHGVYD